MHHQNSVKLRCHRASYHSSVLNAAIIFLSLFTFALATYGVYVSNKSPLLSHDSPISPLGLDFSVPQTEPIAMQYDTTAHYQLDADDSNEEFSHLLPSGGHVVYVEDENGKPEKYTVTLFHQFRCLDIIRQEYNLAARIPPLLVQHCMNYLHQTILCRPNIAIESSKNSLASASRSYDMVCRDWTAVYKESERNQKAYQKSVAMDRKLAN